MFKEKNPHLSTSHQFPAIFPGLQWLQYTSPTAQHVWGSLPSRWLNDRCLEHLLLHPTKQRSNSRKPRFSMEISMVSEELGSFRCFFVAPVKGGDNALKGLYHTTTKTIHTSKLTCSPCKGTISTIKFRRYVSFGVVQNVLWWQMCVVLSPLNSTILATLWQMLTFIMTFSAAFDRLGVQTKTTPPTLPSDPCSEASESTPTRSHINISTRRYQEKNDHRKGSWPGYQSAKSLGIYNYSHAQLFVWT